MMGFGNDVNGWDWGWMVGMMVFWVAVLGVAVWAVLALVRRERMSGGGAPTALEELDRRLARGEIDTDEYKRRREVMRPTGP